MLKKNVFIAWIVILVSLYCTSCNSQPYAAPQALVAADPVCDTWQTTVMSGADVEGGWVNAIMPLGTSDVWTFGFKSNFEQSQPMLHHWNGDRWKIVTIPAAKKDDELVAVSALSPSDIWAVGNSDQGLTAQTLISHWDGTSWTIMPSPNPSSTWNYLSGVAMATANDGWAAGEYEVTEKEHQPMILHWDGKKWSVMQIPQVKDSQGWLASVAVLDSNNVWAVGAYKYNYDNEQRPLIWHPLLMHWNGNMWSIETIPNAVEGVHLHAVTVLSANDIWAVGGYYANNPLGAIMHWDGSRWSTIYGAVLGDGELDGVSAISTSNVWAAGYIREGRGRRAILKHWNGSKWSDVPSPQPMTNTSFNAIVKDAEGGIWLAGAAYNNADDGIYGLIAHTNGTPCAATPTPASAP